MNLKRDNILDQAIHDCYVEMYAKSQPPADYDNLLEEYRTGKIGKDERIYDRHYLSMDEFKYIVNKYVDAYRMNKFWDEYIEILETYLIEGGTKDKWIQEKKDKNGFVHPGYRGYEKVLPLEKQIYNFLNDILYNKQADLDPKELSNTISTIVMNNISNCKNFYRFDKEESDFGIAMALGASPCSNKETVKKWWKENYNVDIEIEEHNPLLFWEKDEYSDDFEDIMKEEYGENWKEYWDNKWQEEVKEKKKETEEKIKKLIEDQQINDPSILQEQ